LRGGKAISLLGGRIRGILGRICERSDVTVKDAGEGCKMTVLIALPRPFRDRITAH
jgi:hypothetical protein